jgi:hypothetical protein
MMRVPVCVSVAVLLLVASASKACMRLQMDDRAVQWSTAIVEAKLVSIDPPVKLEGEVKTFRPPFGVLTSWYYYRVYHMEVTRSLDGTFKNGDSVTIVRPFWRSAQTSCQQNLTKEGIGKEFLAMLMPVSKFKLFFPEDLTGYKLKDGMFIVHLELKETMKHGAIAELENRIANVRGAEQQIDAKQVERLIGQVKNAPAPERAGPALRALERMGPKIVPQLQDAIKNMPPNSQQSALLAIILRLSPPESTQGMVTGEQSIEDEMVKK